MLSKVKTFLAYPIKLQWLLIETASCLFIAKACIKVLPFRMLSKLIGERNKKAMTVDSPEHKATILSGISFAIRQMSKHVFWSSVCLDQALAAKWILQRRQIPSTLYFGVAKGDKPDDMVKAHAWLLVEDESVIGGEGEGYHIIAYFS